MAEYGLVVKVDARQAHQETAKLRGEMGKLNKTFVDSQGKLRNTNGQFVKMSKTAGTARQSFKLLGTTFSTYLAPLVAFGTAVKGVTDSLAVFSQRQKDTAALANGIKGMTTDGTAALASLKKSADELGKATLFDEEDFTKGFKLLTSFRTIGVSSYEEVAGTAADMAQVLDQDVNSVLLQVAKALEAPEVGLTALQRSGTRFTDQQKKQVKEMVAANKTAEAQAFILKELQRQYGGAAEAAGVGFAGAMDSLGEVTRDAMEALGGFVAPAITGGVNLLRQGVEKLSTFFNHFAATVLPAAQKAFAPLIESFQKVFQRIDFEKVGNIIANVVVGALTSMYNIASLITPVIGKIVEALFSMLENSPFGYMVKGIMKVAEALGLTKPLMDDFANQTENVKTGFDDIPPAVDKAVEAQKRKIEALKTSVGLVEQEKQAVQAQEQAYQNSVKITDSRLNAEKEINNLNVQQLENAYKNTEQSKTRLRLATEIFKAELNGAKISYQQTLNRIEAEKRALVFRRQAAQVEIDITKAKGALAAQQAENSEKAKLILERTQDLVTAQKQNVAVLDGQIKAQGQIAENQKITARAVLTQKENSAKVKLEQRLVNDNLVKGTKEAQNISNGLSNAYGHADALGSSTGQVASQARQASYMYVSVADNAYRAAHAISQAAAAQGRLNAARARRAQQAQQTTEQPVEQAAGGYNLGSFTPFAKGGVVRGPTLGLIGEGGEPEYIIPQSKAAGFAANFLSGKRGAGAIPGFADGGMALPSSANVSIQTGPVTQMDGQNFVTTADLGAAVEAGVMQTLDMLRRDQMTRYSMGLS